MSILKFLSPCLSVVFLTFSSYGRQADSTQTSSSFSGTVGISTNGFSINPAFSLNRPGVLVNVALRKNKFSFEPDIRLAPDAKNGGLIWWFRYRLVDNKKFGLRVGAHPAFTLIRRTDTENGNSAEITEMLRFLAFEVVPSYQFTPHFGVSAMYLQGHALQKNGPQLTRVLFLNTAITNLHLNENLRFSLFPTVFFLFTDGHRGDYLTLTALLAHKKSPFSLQATINQTFTSNIPGNKDFMWNLTLNYNFKRYLSKTGKS
ncbi:MAG: hypothetical protein U0X91_18605 [Spirosomataceae bacterium]